MAKIEEQIKAFLSDEKKAEALANDDAFLRKISGGTATPQEISKKFGELGLELNDEEAKALGKTVADILHNTEFATLDDASLDTISGGSWMGAVSQAGFVAGSVGAVGTLGCHVAGLVCKNKANKAAMAGDMTMSDKYTKAASGLDIATTACAGVTVAGLGVGIGFGIPAYKRAKAQHFQRGVGAAEQAVLDDNPNLDFTNDGSWKLVQKPPTDQ